MTNITQEGKRVGKILCKKPRRSSIDQVCALCEREVESVIHRF
jgi:hypothetical protein